MSKQQDFSKMTFTLPTTLVSRADIAHLIYDIEQYDVALTARDTRARSGSSGGQADIAMPESLQSFLSVNQLSLDDSQQRHKLLLALERTKKTLPVVHVTLAVEADREHLEQIVAWLRSNVHPQAVIEVGLQPALIAGAYLRTSNHVFDLSLRGALRDGRKLLKHEIGALRGI